MRNAILAVAVLVALSACASTDPGKTQVVTCDAFNGALTTINALDDQRLLSDSERTTVRQAVSVAAPICGANATLVVDAGSGATDLAGAISAIQAVLTSHGSN